MVLEGNKISTESKSLFQFYFLTSRVEYQKVESAKSKTWLAHIIATQAGVLEVVLQDENRLPEPKFLG